MYFLLKIDVQVHTVKLKETVTSENQKNIIDLCSFE